jgi:hypothetical protein
MELVGPLINRSTRRNDELDAVSGRATFAQPNERFRAPDCGRNHERRDQPPLIAARGYGHIQTLQ